MESVYQKRSFCCKCKEVVDTKEITEKEFAVFEQSEDVNFDLEGNVEIVVVTVVCDKHDDEEDSGI